MNKVPILLILVFFLGCKDKYDLPVRPTDVSLLVVEGTLNAGQGPTTITLSKTVKVNDPAAFKPVLNAKLSVEDKSGNTLALTESGNGNYTNAQLNLITGQEYRLRIKTTDNKEYLSDYVPVKATPAIDSVTWKKENGNITIYANSHDASNNTRYYKWDYDETWEIRSYYVADYRYTGVGAVIVPAPTYHYRCWKFAKSDKINLASTAALTSDVVSQAPVQIITPGSEKLSIRYSILLKQQALSKEAYSYFQLMKKNTESLGSIFDPQPSELKGNIKCITNPDEGVVGYFTASNITEKRIFITAQEAGWTYPQVCNTERVKNNPDSLQSYLPSFLPWGAEELVPGVITYYLLAPAPCVDCTKRGGDVTMPSYW